MRSIDLPNLGLIEYTLTEEQLNHVYSLIKKTSPDGYEWEANEITKINELRQQWGLLDEKNKFQNEILQPMVDTYLVKYGLPFLKNTTHQHGFTFQRWWANVTTTGQYQALHNHDSVFSFVLWVNIPYHTDDERAIKGQMRPETGDFMLLYQDILGRQRKRGIHLTPNDNGKIVLFPSQLMHAVYPHFTTDKPRISVAGDISISSHSVQGPINGQMIESQLSHLVDSDEKNRLLHLNSQEYIVKDREMKIQHGITKFDTP
tara:strand:+ start:4132 stop:4911 length:780 start_codon:yes stop_codon:yes gene_type:complete